MRITTLLLVSMCVLAILLSAPFVSNAQSGCVPPSHQVVVYTSSQQYLYWKPADPSDNITYDVRWKCPNNTCAGQQIILAANALHTTMGYIGIPLPAGITPTTLKASIFELGCTPNYTICDYRLAGDLITDNIDVIEAPGIDKCYIQTIPPSYAEELSGYAN
ncbi:MAG TPA: hypothetical protein PLD84_15755, partial [Chitinophagales bacterium]|nr:hypothetical protein [Chitinophagales bacterium]